MLAIIRKGNGEYYTSLVFGHYHNTKKYEDEYQQYLSNTHDNYYIVLNEEKDTLVKQVIFPRGRSLVPYVIIVDPDDSNWITDENNNGCVNFLPIDSLLELVEDDEVPDDLLSKCIEEDSKIRYEEYQTVKNKYDTEKIAWASGDFHDAYVKDIQINGDSMYVLLDGIWGCEIEFWFDGDVSYSLEGRTGNYDPYWVEGAVVICKEHIILIDEYDTAEDEIDYDRCWFKGRSMKYHIIPI